MENKYKKEIERICEWVRYHGKYSGYDECPKVGYLGYANGMTSAEWTVICVASDMISEDGLNPSEYFSYDVDCSG